MFKFCRIYKIKFSLSQLHFDLVLTIVRNIAGHVIHRSSTDPEHGGASSVRVFRQLIGRTGAEVRIHKRRSYHAGM